MSLPTRDTLRTALPLRLDGFPAEAPYGSLDFHVPGGASMQARFDAFRKRVTDAIGTRYLPVYRMADGEFSFLVGWRAPLSGQPDLQRRVYWEAKELVSRLGYRAVETCWG